MNFVELRRGAAAGGWAGADAVGYDGLRRGWSAACGTQRVWHQGGAEGQRQGSQLVQAEFAGRQNSRTSSYFLFVQT